MTNLAACVGSACGPVKRATSPSLAGLLPPSSFKLSSITNRACLVLNIIQFAPLNCKSIHAPSFELQNTVSINQDLFFCPQHRCNEAVFDLATIVELLPWLARDG